MTDQLQHKRGYGDTGGQNVDSHAPTTVTAPTVACNPQATARRRRLGRLVVAKLPRASDTLALALETPGKATDKGVTAKCQAMGLAAGTHPRCGARCPLLQLSREYYGIGGGTLVLRLLWDWLMNRVRFFCVTLDGSRGTTVITFGVSLVLLTVTHDMKWWVDVLHIPPIRPLSVLGASHSYLVCMRLKTFGRRLKWIPVLQDIVTGAKISLWASNMELPRWPRFNGKWNPVTSTAPPSHNRIVVSLDVIKGRRWKQCRPQFGSHCEDCVLLLFSDDPLKTNLLVLVDLAQTFSSSELVVVSSTVPQTVQTGPLIRFVGRLTRQGGAHSLVLCLGDTFAAIEEGTGKQHFLDNNIELAQLDESRFCSFELGGHSACYDVWDFKDIEHPLKTTKYLSSYCLCSSTFTEGGLLFQVNEGLNAIHVTDEESGFHIVTFKLLSSMNFIASCYSFLLGD
ncbi:hypothetical protein Pelo_11754 [Pelomyxa schiedti]|nr:hypothetical protein Pelo_11754 [Pelomyxa schiedti]